MNILIKTYPHKSGLLYLGLSLKKSLESKGHNVKFIPKRKYIKVNNSYKSRYLQPEYNLFYHFESNKNHSYQVRKAIKSFDADLIVSFETFMQDHQWIKDLDIDVIDVPMVEWVSQKHIADKSYDIFKEVWSLTEHTTEAFKDYSNITEKSWNYVDSELFSYKAKNNEVFTLYHQASLNADHSTKNTANVVDAFIRFSKEHDSKLYITGDCDVKKCINIQRYNEVLSRREVSELYKLVDCVVAPSEREGLGLSFYEALACGCDLITTDMSPMNVHKAYLCDVDRLIEDRSLIPRALVSSDSIYEQLKSAYRSWNVR